MVYQVLPIIVFPPIWIIILRRVFIRSLVFSKEQYQDLYCFCYISMICPIVCFILNQECMLIGHTYLTYSNGNIHSIQSLLSEDLLILIEHSHSSKSLGVLIDKNPTCGNHVDTIRKKAASGNPSIIVCPLPPCMLSITATNHILTTTACYGVACAPIGY